MLDFVGESPAVLRILSIIEKAAPTPATVLIQGESGNGKRLIARILHSKSKRASNPYIALNCENSQNFLFESELFGHEKGAFTGEFAGKIGFCEMAEGGTLFLSQISEISMSTQTKLLRLLQDGEFYKIGGNVRNKANVRIISSTNKNLEQEVKQNRFREDLFYLLSTVTLNVPPLRYRKDDIPILVDFFLKNSSLTSCNDSVKKLDSGVIETFLNYSWPGNVQELKNILERLKILAQNGQIHLEDVPINIRMPNLEMNASTLGEPYYDIPLEILEKKHILRTLAHYHGNKTKTANSLGITIKTLYNKLYRYGVLVPNSTTTS